MTERTSDTQLDFLDDAATGDTHDLRARRRRRDGGGPRRPVTPTPGVTPLLRLVGLIAFAIAVVVLLVLWFQGCRSASERDTYRDYMNSVGTIAADSEQVGEELNVALTTPGIKLPELRQKLANLAQQQEQDVARARELSAPGRLRLQHQQAVEALQFRVSGLRRLQDALQQGENLENPGEAGALLAAQMRRLVANDVIWDDQFMEPAIELLRTEEIGGVEVPDSNFLGTPDLATDRAMVQVWERIQGAATTEGTPAGLHGNALVSVRALPDGQVLSREEENIVVATADLAFEATIENSGDSQEVRVKVRLEADQRPRPIRQEQTIDLINPGERKAVVFRDLGQIVQFQQQMNVKIEVVAVAGETRLENNSATFKVRFTITRP